MLWQIICKAGSQNNIFSMKDIDNTKASSEDLKEKLDEEIHQAEEVETEEKEDNSVEIEIEDEDKPKESKKRKNIFGKESEKDKLKTELEEQKEKFAEVHDKYLRLYSEFDNYRKRTQKEKLEIIKNASEDMIMNLLPVVDDFERALENLQKSDDIEALSEGVNLIFQKFYSILEKKGLKPIEAKNEKFDTDFHEAITQIPLQEGMEENVIVDEIEKGYMLNEKVIRYSKVVIAK